MGSLALVANLNNIDDVVTRNCDDWVQTIDLIFVS